MGQSQLVLFGPTDDKKWCNKCRAMSIFSKACTICNACKRLYMVKKYSGDRVCTKCKTEKKCQDFSPAAPQCKSCSRLIASKKVELVRGFKRGLGCFVCGEDEPCTLHFHHMDPDNKTERVANLHHGHAHACWKEIIKCVLLCGNCHSKFHNGVIPDTWLSYSMAGQVRSFLMPRRPHWQWVRNLNKGEPQ